MAQRQVRLTQEEIRTLKKWAKRLVLVEKVWFGISRRYIYIPMVLIIVYLKESPPLHWGIVDWFIKGFKKVFRLD